MTRLAHDLESTLPPLLAEIAEVAGVDIALLIASEHGGTRIVVPSRSQGDNWLTALVEPAMADAIIDHLGSARRIEIPLAPDRGYLGARRRQLAEMRRMTDEGKSAAFIARKLNTTERSVRRWWARWRHQDPNQRDLFMP